MMTKNLEVEEYEQVEPENAVHLAEHIQVCRRRIWLILSFVALFGSLAAVSASSQNPVYQAKAGFMIEPLHPVVLQTEEYPEEWESDLFSVRIETHIKLLVSYPVLEETARRINLIEQPEYQSSPSWMDNVKAWVHEMKRSITGTGSEGEAVTGQMNSLEVTRESVGVPQNLVEGFGKKIIIDYIKGSKLVNVTVESEDPEFAAHAANSLINVYMERVARQRSQKAISTTQWYTSHLDSLREKVRKSEQAVYAYRLKNGLVDASEAQTVAEQQLIEQNKELSAVETSLTAAQTRYQQIQAIQAKLRANASDGQILDRSELDSLTELRTHQVIQDLRSKEVALSVQMARLSEKYGARHPTMVHGQTELKELRARIAHEIDGIYHAAKQDYLLWLAREKAAKEALKKQEKEKLALDKLEVQFRILEREATSDRQLYDLFLKQMSEKNMAAQIKTSNMYLADPAISNSTPVRPRPVLMTLLGLIAGLGLGVGMAFFLEYWDRSLKGPKDVERYLTGHPLLGWVPRLTTKSKERPSRIMQTAPSCAIAESYRYIRTNVRLAVPDDQVMSVVITSPGEQEGKTTLAVNLSIGFSQLEENRVVLIDANLHQPWIHQIFRIKHEKDKGRGLIQYLSGEAEAGEILHQTEIPNLAVIPSGGEHPNAAELLHSKRLDALLEWCRTNKLHVMIDTPAVAAFPDALVVARQVYGTILVVRAGKTDRDAAKTVLQQLGVHRIRILGIVMQNVPQDRVDRTRSTNL